MLLNAFFMQQDEKSNAASPRQEGEDGKSDQDKERESLKESKDSRESLRERSGTLKSKDREKSAKSDKGEKEKLPKTAEKADKSRAGSKLSVIDKPERNKSGGPSPKGRRMSRMEKPGGDLLPKSKYLFD